MDAVSLYENACKRLDNGMISIEEFEELIKPLRNVEPARRKAMWVKGRNFSRWEHEMIVIANGGFEAGLKYCTNCCKMVPSINGERTETKFCYNCGADMRGVDDESTL